MATKRVQSPLRNNRANDDQHIKQGTILSRPTENIMLERTTLPRFLSEQRNNGTHSGMSTFPFLWACLQSQLPGNYVDLLEKQKVLVEKLTKHTDKPVSLVNRM